MKVGNRAKLAEFKPIVQEHAMGCGLACVAFVLNKTYRSIFNSIDHPAFAWTRGFYCPELVSLLSAHGRNFRWRAIRNNRSPNSPKILDGSIVFVGPSEEYPMGHFMVKVSDQRFMNPWVNFPEMRSAKAGFVREPGRITHVIEPLDI